MAALETIYTSESSSLKIGPGATREAGFDLARLGARRVLVVTDPRLAASAPVATALESLRTAGIAAEVFDHVRVEPTDGSFKEAIEVAVRGGFDGYVAIGGGSSIDTAKAANLYATYPADFLAYVNQPIGEGRPVPGALKPLIAIPTTIGTGSEATGVAIFDFEALRAKTGIAHRALRPALGIVDPDNLRSLPPMVAACSGFDVLCHAIESLTVLPYHRRPAPESPLLRPAYQGANPISDIWAGRALELAAAHIVQASAEPGAAPEAAIAAARAQMQLAATFAGMGFGNAGLHLAHGMSYAVSGLVRDYMAPGYPGSHPLIPHGMSVVLNAPAVFRFTAPADPERHLHAAHLMGVDVSGVRPEQAGDVLAEAIIRLMRQTGMPNGLQAVGYTPADIDRLVEGTLPQHRVTRLSPRPFTADDLRRLFLDAMRYW
jgi:hydroxyacid-oxoacid transhydrogenase